MNDDEYRRKEIAREALDLPAMGLGFEGDVHWLTNMHGSVPLDEIRDDADRLRREADILNEAANRIENGELTVEEAALFIAENAELGDYDTHDHLYDGLPIDPDHD